MTISMQALTKTQCELANQIYKYAKPFTPYPSTMVYIAGVETSYGDDTRLIGDDGRSIGYLQIQVPTARQTAKWYPRKLGWMKKLTNEQIETLLLTNLQFSVRIATLYFEYNRKRFNYTRAVMLHNGGLHNWKYYNKVIAQRGIYQKCKQR